MFLNFNMRSWESKPNMGGIIFNLPLIPPDFINCLVIFINKLTQFQFMLWKPTQMFTNAFTYSCAFQPSTEMSPKVSLFPLMAFLIHPMDPWVFRQLILVNQFFPLSIKIIKRKSLQHAHFKVGYEGGSSTIECALFSIVVEKIDQYNKKLNKLKFRKLKLI